MNARNIPALSIPPMRGNDLVAENDEAEPGERLEAFYIACDKELEAQTLADPWGEAKADRMQAQELNRLPNGGYLHG